MLRVQDGRRRFEWRDGRLYQRSALWPDLEWEMSLVKDNVNPSHPTYNAKSARAKLMSKNVDTLEWGQGVAKEDRAHNEDEMLCFTCHLSWTTSCGGCHLPIQANWKTPRNHYEGGVSRNYATYNPQVVRDQMFQLGRHQTTEGNKIAPIRSSSALVLSSQNINRERIYVQQAPIAASGHSSQAFSPHFPHTVRKTETKTCTDCHVSEENDNNAIMAQLLLQGTNYINFIGHSAWVGEDGGLEAIKVTEWDEPQAVYGSYLQKYAYPDWYQDHPDRNRELTQEIYNHPSDRVGCIQLRGEYLFVAEGPDGFQAYDVASIANKGISQRIIKAPFAFAGHRTQIDTKNATCMALPTEQSIAPTRNEGDLMRIENQKQPFHPIYHYAFITDSEEGLIVTNVDTLADGEARNNFFTRSLTWNPDGILDGARHITIAGYYFYIVADKGVVVLNMDDPLNPKVESVLPVKNRPRDGVAVPLPFRHRRRRFQGL